jgi:hypothetical protein
VSDVIDPERECIGLRKILAKQRFAEERHTAGQSQAGVRRRAAIECVVTADREDIAAKPDNHQHAHQQIERAAGWHCARLIFFVRLIFLSTELINSVGRLSCDSIDMPSACELRNRLNYENVIVAVV